MLLVHISKMAAQRQKIKEKNTLQLAQDKLLVVTAIFPLNYNISE